MNFSQIQFIILSTIFFARGETTKAVGSATMNPTYYQGFAPYDDKIGDKTYSYISHNQRHGERHHQGHNHAK